jgi:hypothetical protein
MEIAGSREFVTVTLTGAKSSESLRFHVDTGGNTPGLMIRRSVAERLGFASADAMPYDLRIGDHDVHVPGGANWIFMDDADGETRFEQATRKDFAVGQLGAGFLSRFVLCVDPGHARLGLGDPAEFDLEAKDAKWARTTRSTRSFIYCCAITTPSPAATACSSIPGRRRACWIATRWTFSTAGTRTFASGAFGDADMLGGQLSEEIIRAPDVAFNTPGAPSGHRFGEPISIDLGPATFVDRPTGTWGRMFGDVRATMGSHGAVANDVLLRYRLVLDYPHARLFADPSGRPVDPSASPVRIGVAVRFGDDGCPEVRQVTDTNAPDTRATIDPETSS